MFVITTIVLVYGIYKNQIILVTIFSISILKEAVEILIVFKLNSRFATIIIAYNNVILAASVPFMMSRYYFDSYSQIDIYFVGCVMMIIHVVLLNSYNFIENLISIILIFALYLAFSI